MSEKKKITAYIIVTLVVSFIYQGIMALVTRDTSSEKFTNLGLILMYFPGLIAFAFMFFFKEGFKNIGWGIKRPLFLLYSLAIPLLITLLGFFLLEFLGLGSQTIFSFKNSKIIFIGKEMSIIAFIPYFLTGFVLGSIQSGIFALGEEIGWRGYLQNKMIKEFGLISGIIYLGLVWGYWHLPIILMGYNFPEYPILGGFILMPLMTIGFSSIWAWLTLRAKSIWPAVLAHGAINTLLDTFVKKIDSTQKIWVYLALTGLWLIAGFVAISLLKNAEKRGRLESIYFQ
jgi:membrane protease YdiL (CAAX protease family)